MSYLPNMPAVVRLLGASTLALLLGAAPARGQVEVSGAHQSAQDLPFYVDAISFADASGKGSRLDVFVQVGYDILSFVKGGDAYDASYEITISIYDSTKALVTEKSWTEEIRGVPFEQSVSPNLFSLTQRVFSLPPGRYGISVAIRDNESKNLWRRNSTVLVSDYTQGRFAFSDVMMISRIAEKDGKRSVIPNISTNVANNPESFLIYLEAYSSAGIDSTRVLLTVVDVKSEVTTETDTVVAVKNGRNEYLLRVPNSSQPIGDYRLFVRAFMPATPRDNKDAFIGVTDKQFVVRWSGFPRSIKDIDLAIDQVRYIARDEEYSTMKDAKTPADKQAKLLEFWKRRDPNPNTPRNERMEEYYRRVEYANKNFTHHIEGWRTDMGMVFLMFGPPNDVSRHPFEVDSKPYELWRYYDINYEFVFVDETGFGDYRLLTPVWEAWQRVKQ